MCGSVTYSEQRDMFRTFVLLLDVKI
jgi:hypothetical protein